MIDGRYGYEEVRESDSELEVDMAALLEASLREREES
jgi:hypothetical protein